MWSLRKIHIMLRYDLDSLLNLNFSIPVNKNVRIAKMVFFFSQGNIFCFIIIFLSVSFVSIVSSYIINYQVFGTSLLWRAYSLLEHKTSYILSRKLILLKRIQATISMWLLSDTKIILLNTLFHSNFKGILKLLTW